MIVASHSTTRSLDAFPSRRNSLNFLRLLLAVLVIVSHSWPIGGFGPDPRLGQFTLGTMAVAGFFTISGWLITESRMSGRLVSFAWRRAVRLYPGYLAALLAVAFLFAPVGSLLAGTSYAPVDGLRYVSGNITMQIHEWTVGATLPSTAYPAWNGSLWTLFSEAACYAVIGLLVTIFGRRFTPTVVLAAWIGLSLLQLNVGSIGVPGVDAPGYVYEFLSLAPFFFAGAALFVLRRHLPLHGGTALGCAGLFALLLLTSANQVFAALPIAYLMLWCGARLPFHTIARRNDISYGMYIYAFPAQQLVALAGGTALGIAPYILACLVATVPFAAASWFLVERPAQRARGLFDRPAVPEACPLAAAPEPPERRAGPMRQRTSSGSPSRGSPPEWSRRTAGGRPAAGRAQPRRRQ
jgi:peptidoglycan/LPS O-acetylase OafA/YrhL